MTLIKNNVKTVNPTEDLLKAPYGLQVADIITNDSDHIGDWYCIMSLKDSTQLDNSSCVVNWALNGADFTVGADVDLITGVPMYGDWTTISLVAGIVIAYRK